MRKICEIGRSMVEMLGVLAIIGVLSVGGIAGYSKAMFKYKLNKQTEQLNQLMSALLQHYHKFSFTSDKENLTKYFVKMGEVPEEMIVKNDENNIYDIFSNRVNFTYDNPYIVITMLLELEKASVKDMEICKNVVTAAQNDSGNIYNISSVASNEDGGYDDKAIWGDKNCKTGRTCLNNMTIDDTYKFCNAHIGKSGGHLKIYYRFD